MGGRERRGGGRSDPFVIQRVDEACRGGVSASCQAWWLIRRCLEHEPGLLATEESCSKSSVDLSRSEKTREL
jgi:hypothetical protein